MRPQLLTLAALFQLACARGVDPALVARNRLRELARAILAGDARAIESRIIRRRTPPSASDMTAERREAAAWVRTLADRGHSRVTLTTAIAGALGTVVEMTRDTEGWRVEPESIAISATTPVEVVEHLIMALERLETDEALGLLDQPMRDVLVTASRERATGLRELLPTLTRDAPGPTQMRWQMTYGHGLRLVLTFDHGRWRVGDFN